MYDIREPRAGLWERLKTWLARAFYLWVGGSLIFFFGGLVTGLFPMIPRFVPIPWSCVGDYVVAPDGDVFVDIQFYESVVRYDREGNFVATYHYPCFNGKLTQLAVDDAGFVYFHEDGTVYKMTKDWRKLAVVSDPERDVRRRWTLGDDRLPRLAPERRGLTPTRPIRPGDILFANDFRGDARIRFRCSDGSLVRRSGYHLERISPDGEVTARYGSAWIYLPFVVPFPALLAFPALFAVMIYGELREQRERQRVPLWRPSDRGD